MKFRQTPQEVQLFALGFLSPQDIDGLQLVDSLLCALVDDNRLRLPRYTLSVLYNARAHGACRGLSPLVLIRPALFFMTCHHAPWVGCSDENAADIARGLNTTRVGYIPQLFVVGDIPDGGEEVLGNLLGQIPVGTVEISDSECPLAAIRLATQLAASCLELKLISPSLVPPQLHDGQSTLGHTIPHLIYYTILMDDEPTRLARLLFRDPSGPAYEGRVVVDMSHAVFTAIGVFVDNVCQRFRDGESFPRDILLIMGGLAEADIRSWPSVLPEEEGEPMASDSMEEWWKEAARESPLQSYYRRLKGCEWRVWWVEGTSQSGGSGVRRLRAMQRLGGGIREGVIAVHFEVVSDA